MSRETDWHVFDKACDMAAMALRGTADDVQPAAAAELFTAIYGALKDAATGIESGGQQAGFQRGA
ncbi:MAG TPA: hypothetical protein VE032_02785 [Actinomycetota bacterium]|nr:hypothetical protein [Actinomycetota bacterium]